MMFILGVGVGLTLGWLLIPAPQLVTDFWARKKKDWFNGSP